MKFYFQKTLHRIHYILAADVIKIPQTKEINMYNKFGTHTFVHIIWMLNYIWTRPLSLWIIEGMDKRTIENEQIDLENADHLGNWSWLTKAIAMSRVNSYALKF